LQEAALARLERRTALENAIESGELRLHYQPIVRLSDHGITGLEPWCAGASAEGPGPAVGVHSLRRGVGPHHPLGKWVLNQACADLARWQRSWRAAYGVAPHVSVNVSPDSSSPDSSSSGRQGPDTTLRRSSSLTVEITESCLVEDSVEVLSCLRRLDERIALSLDDFGTGYSSLSYLQRFPMRILKIDQSSSTPWTQ